jgi:hypothetical protein
MTGGTCRPAAPALQSMQHTHETEVIRMRLPGFAAEASLHTMSGRYRHNAMAADQDTSNTVIAQLSVGTFPGSSPGDWLDTLGTWLCSFVCQMAHTACLNDCEGTWENPKPSMNCVICDQTYADCLKGCRGPAKA